MTVWTHAIAWSKLKSALECPRQLQHTIDKKPHGRPAMTYHAHLGTLVQKTFQNYFNQRVNEKAKGRSSEFISRAAKKTADAYLGVTEISYKPGQNEANLRRELDEQTRSGLEALRGMGLLAEKVNSEVKLNAVFRGFRLFAKVDFLVEKERGDALYDGKGNLEKNADPRQILYYALNRAAAGRRIIHAGLIYWRHGFEEVDCSPAALRNFIDTDLAEARPIFERLRHGINEPMEAKPGPTTCRFCNWRDTCEVSYYLKPELTKELGEETGFR